MTDDSNRKTRGGPLRALSNWFRRASSATATPDPSATESPERSPNAGSEPVPPPRDQAQPTLGRIGHYAITRKLGQGGMGVVYAARDERLGRTVALKWMSAPAPDDNARKRFWREARAAASVNHPHVCQLYDIGEDQGRLYIAMELLEGEALGERLRRGPLSPAEALPIALEILDALSALHSRGITHRDLKPSNVFVTGHGVKLLDFGLAQIVHSDAEAEGDTLSGLTQTGMVVGTPRYMAPEQVSGGGIDGRTDLFALGAILFEMLAGRPAFTGRNVVEILHATMSEQPPALTGSPAVAAMDRVIRRALAKRPEDRPGTADSMADELRAVEGAHGHEAPAVARALTRLVVLPFRTLRADSETDFLAFSLPDAIATSLSRHRSLVVRSSATAARFAGGAPDLKTLAVEADVDRVVMGTLLRSGDRLQVSAQLVEAPSGTLMTSHTVLSSLGDLFRLQEDITRRMVETLASSLGAEAAMESREGGRAAGAPAEAYARWLGGGASPGPDAPGDAQAYELYLRANAIARSYDRLPEARDLYRRCVELDPQFAPAWAQLGRCHRVIGKFIGGVENSEALAEEALRRALELNPRLSLAHKFYANLEADTGQALSAVTRLLREAERRGNDPELFAGLVHACRYCGLFEQAIAAHAEARRLDPNVPTSVEQTLLMMGDIERLLATRSHSVVGGDEVIRVIGLGLAGRRDEARRALLEMREASRVAGFRTWADYLRAWLDRRPADMHDLRSALGGLRVMNDPEAMFQQGWLLCDVGDFERGLDLVRHGVARAYFVAPTLSKSPAFDGLRSDPVFQDVLREAEAGRERALAAFREGGGERLLGL